MTETFGTMIKISNFVIVFFISSIHIVYSFFAYLSGPKNPQLAQAYETSPVGFFIGFVFGAGVTGFIMYGLPVWGLLFFKDKMAQWAREESEEEEHQEMDQAA